MKRTGKILVVLLLIVSFSAQLAYANSFSDFFTTRKGFTSGVTGAAKVAVNSGTSFYNKINRNKVGRVLISPVKIGIRANKAVAGSIAKSRVGKSAISIGRKIGGGVRKNPGAVELAAGATLATGNPVIGGAVGTGVVAGKSSFVRPWVQKSISGISSLFNRGTRVVLRKQEIRKATR